MRLSRSIRNRFVVATVALVTVGIASLLLLSFYLGDQARAALRDATLDSELDDAVVTLAHEPAANFSQSRTIRIYRAQDVDLPAGYIGLAPGSHPMVDIGAHIYHVVVRETQYGRLYASFEVTGREKLEAANRRVITICGIVIVLVVALCSVWLARGLLAPVGELAERLGEISPEDRTVRLGESFGGTELAPIANSIDGFLERLDGFVEREQSFTESASHELRSPLAVIQGATELLAEQAKAEPQLARTVERMRRATRDMADFTQTLLLLSREPKSVTNPAEECDVTEIAQRVIDEQRLLLAGKPVNIRCHCGNPIPVAAPASLVKIVLSNLLRNALYATDTGSVECRAVGRTFELHDSGAGIPQEAIDKVFDRNFSLRPGGHGVGLHLTKRICDHFGWSVGLESTATGTVARVTF